MVLMCCNEYLLVMENVLEAFVFGTKIINSNTAGSRYRFEEDTK